MNGRYCLIRKKKPAPEAGSPVYFPGWYVKFDLPGKPAVMKSAKAEICPRCLAADQVAEGCGCQKTPRKWAEAWMKTARVLLQQERLDDLAALRVGRRPAAATVGKVCEVYLSRIPTKQAASGAQNVRRLRCIVEQGTGRAAEEQPVSVLTWALFLDWAQMRQEAARRGWLVRGAAPAEAWDTLRRELAAGQLPPLDKSKVVPGNTTLKSHLNCARAVIGPTSRSEYLRGMKLPDLSDFLTGKVKLPAPKGHREIAPNAYAAMYAAAPSLREGHPALWVVNQMLWRFGCRPIEVWQARPEWIEKDAEGPMFVLKNRPEEGFYLKSEDRAIVRRLRIAPDLWAGMQEVMTTGSLIGSSSPTAAQCLVERTHNAWVRSYVPDGKHASYLFRHHLAAAVTERWGLKMASAFLGHATSATLSGERVSMTESRYGDLVAPLPAITWADLAPRGV